jgi:alpha-methylacyl-CoA racemase
LGPLNGLRVIELEALGAAPFAGMLLADLGAEVISVTRQSSGEGRPAEISARNKQSIALNLKRPEAVEVVLRLCATADVLIEGLRPGVTERLGIGPEPCLARNPRLVYGRMTGWGQLGPLAHAAGHDINYLALSGALHAIGRAGQRPVPPLNLVGDFGGGGLLLAFGIMCAVFEARQSGAGQVVDAAMLDGSATLMHLMHSLRAKGEWIDERESNILDGAAHFYDTYETADGKYIAIGSIEPQFYSLLLKLTGSDPREFSHPRDKARWPALKRRLTEAFRTRTREEWIRAMEGTDVCFAPVLSMEEAPRHPHNQARRTFIEVGGVTQAAPAPRFSRTPAATPGIPHPAGSDTQAVLEAAGYGEADIERLRKAGALP